MNQEPLAHVAQVSAWLSGQCGASVPPDFVPPAPAYSTLDGVGVPMLFMLALDQGQPAATRVRAMNILGDAYLSSRRAALSQREQALLDHILRKGRVAAIATDHSTGEAFVLDDYPTDDAARADAALWRSEFAPVCLISE